VEDTVLGVGEGGSNTTLHCRKLHDEKLHDLHYNGYHTEDETGGACSTHGEHGNA